MEHSENSILKILSLPSVGRKTAFKLLKELTFSLNSYVDLIDFVKENSKLIRNTLSTIEIKEAFDKAEIIIERSEKADIKLIGYYNSEFPALLKNIDDTPLLLSIKGPYRLLNEMPSVAIIGTREPSDFGYKVGVRLGEVFGESGFNVVSGLAIGCDTAGHIGCLKCNGVTSAVLAHGLDTIYPKENKQLAEKILDKGGILISEYLIGQRSQPNYFVERDRIQAGVSQAVIVVETDIKGGTMHTVKFATNNKRIVAAFNHDSKYLYHPKTQGNQYLIKNKIALPLADPISIENLKITLLDLSKQILPKLPQISMPTPAIVSNTINKKGEGLPQLQKKDKKKTMVSKKDEPSVMVKNSKNKIDSHKKIKSPIIKKSDKSIEYDKKKLGDQLKIEYK